MAVVWQKTVNGKRYEVRTAGQTQRLYTDGVFHSQFNPNKTLTGNVWDLLSLPSFFLAPEQLRRVLVLGVGGGAVIHQLASWYPGIDITGVELDKTHIAIAREFFQLKPKHTTLIHADAIDWVKRYRGLPFDLVIDDLFTEEAGEPVRAIEASKNWLHQLSRLQTAHAALVMNFTETKDLREVVNRLEQLSRRKYHMAYRFMTPLYVNQIGVFLRQPSKKNEWRRRLAQHSPVNQEFENKQDKYQIRKLFG